MVHDRESGPFRRMDATRDCKPGPVKVPAFRNSAPSDVVLKFIGCRRTPRHRHDLPLATGLMSILPKQVPAGTSTTVSQSEYTVHPTRRQSQIRRCQAQTRNPQRHRTISSTPMLRMEILSSVEVFRGHEKISAYHSVPVCTSQCRPR